MTDAFLIITAVVFAVGLLFMALLVLAYFVHEDDKNEALVPKIVVVFGLWLTFAAVLVLPYDVSNSRGVGGGIRVDILWQIVFITIAVMIAVIIPFAFFFYESDHDPDEEPGCCAGQCCSAAQYTIVFFFLFAVVLIILYFTLGEALVPVHRIAQSETLLVSSPAGRRAERCPSDSCVEGTFTWVIPVTFTLYVMGFLGFVGWWFFTLFVGVGLVALPFDLVNEWRTRPEPIGSAEYHKRRLAIGRRAKKLYDIGMGIRTAMHEPGSKSRRQRKIERENLIKFEAAYYFLKKDWKLLRVAYELSGGNPVWYFFKLLLGIIGAIISITWIVHIGVFILPTDPVHPFLNQFFIILEEKAGSGGDFPIFGISAFAMYSFYLLWCVLKGNFRIGVRFLFFKLYPMELHNTMMNAFLANVWILLVCTVPTIQFCVVAFPVYARFTSVDLMLGTQARNLRGFLHFFRNNVFIYAILALNGLTLLLLFFRPRDRAAEVEKKLEEIENESDDD